MNKALFGQVSVLKILVIICSNLVIKVSSGKVEIEIRLVEIEDSVVEYNSSWPGPQVIAEMVAEGESLIWAKPGNAESDRSRATTILFMM